MEKRMRRSGKNLILQRSPVRKHSSSSKRREHGDRDANGHGRRSSLLPHLLDLLHFPFTSFIHRFHKVIVRMTGENVQTFGIGFSHTFDSCAIPEFKETLQITCIPCSKYFTRKAELRPGEECNHEDKSNGEYGKSKHAVIERFPGEEMFLVFVCHLLIIPLDRTRRYSIEF